ncbi:flagella assembly protein FlgT middle domain-containing protein [Cellvibrio japonicus]|nr:flagella assembly protein FlgT middle domain-containing protein [Cellvibrio japonicus]
MASATQSQAEPLIPEDIAYQPGPRPVSDTTPTSLPPPVAEPEPDAIRMEPPVAPTDTCKRQSPLRKTLTLTSFTRLSPHMANAGGLHELEQGLPQLLRDELMQREVISANLLNQGIAQEATEDQRQRQAQELARRHHTQFVLAGSILDMTMDDPGRQYNPGLWQGAANLFHDLTTITSRDKRTRQLALYLELRDGFTGEALLSRRYHTQGIWNQQGAPRFNSAAFHRSDYGKAIYELVGQMGEDLANTLACQPFIAAIDAAPGRPQVIIDSGANQGLRAGDQMELYQLLVVPSQTRYMASETRLIKRNSRLQLQEVYPSHSTAVLVDGQYLNGAFLAISD